MPCCGARAPRNARNGSYDIGEALFDRGHLVGPPGAPDPTLLRWLLPRYLHDRPWVRQLATDCPDARTEGCQAPAGSIVYGDCCGFALKPSPRRPQGEVGPLISDEPQALAAEFNSAFDYGERRGVRGTQGRKEGCRQRLAAPTPFEPAIRGGNLLPVSMPLEAWPDLRGWCLPARRAAGMRARPATGTARSRST